jgi:hypothetical protein
MVVKSKPAGRRKPLAPQAALTASEAADVADVVGTVDEDLHKHIPRRADGSPVFLILPPGVLQSYERRIRACERAWRDRCDPAAIAQAAIWASNYRQPHPKWLTDAIQVLAKRTDYDVKRERDAAKRLARHQAVHDFMYKIVDGRRVRRTAGDVKRDRDAAIRRAIDDLTHKIVDGRRVERTADDIKRDPDVARKLTQLKSRQRALAAEECKKPSWPQAYEHASELLAGKPEAGEPRTMEAAYKSVLRDLKEGRGGEYFIALPVRRKSIERLGEPLRLIRVKSRKRP